GIDLLDIEIVVQYQATCDFNMLWQWFGRAGQGTSTSATVVFLVGKSHFDEVRLKKLRNQAKKASKCKAT
ncbi:hypothetical protein K435DRAFT_595397, partial [Dendrothele bispora CBS 962.96]